MAGRVHDGGRSDGGPAEAQQTIVGSSNDRGVAELLQEIGVSIGEFR